MTADLPYLPLKPEESAMSVAPHFMTDADPAQRGHTPSRAPLLKPVRLPATEPPFDDEIGRSLASPVARYGRPVALAASTARNVIQSGIAEAPAHSLTEPAVLPPSAPPARMLRLLHGGRVRPVPVPAPRSDTPSFGPGALVRIGGPVQDRADHTDDARLASLPDPRPLGGQIVQAVVEVLSGDRPLTQLLTWLDERIYTELSALAPKPATTPTVGRVRDSVIRPQDRPKVRSVHVTRPAPGVAEVAARVETNGRSRAVALRLEEWRGRWRCSALVVG